MMIRSTSSSHRFVLLSAIVGVLLIAPRQIAAAACASTPCQNGGTCTDVAGNLYTCTCDAGYSGFNCQTDINECVSAPCKNGGTCVDGLNGYTCTCAAGYQGALCETDINECGSTPCRNSGTCTDLVNGFSCLCRAGFIGTICETDVNECASHPCKNGGTCVDYVNSFYCNCVAGYSGKTCDTDINECASVPCKNDAVCTDLVNSYTCTCAPGITGTYCETDLNECASDPCQNGGTCIDSANRFICRCADTYSGTTCAQKTCEVPVLYACDGTSARTASEFYQISQVDGSIATDIGSQTNEYGCSALAQSPFTGRVLSFGNSFDTDSYALFGEDVTSGLSTVSVESSQQLAGITDMVYQPGSDSGLLWQLITQGTSLQTMDPSTGIVTNLGITGVNGAGGAMIFDPNNSTKLLLAIGPNLYSVDVYLNALGDFAINPAVKRCAFWGVPFDQCTINPRFSAFANASGQVFGWFQCQSPVKAGQLTYINTQSCHTQFLPSSADTSTPLGMTGLTGYVDRTACPCASNPCHNGAECIDHNLAGGFNCSCVAGFTGTYCETDINECASDPCTNGGTCVDHVNAFRCSCIPGWSGIHCETDTNECASVPCQQGANCTDYLNSYSCACPAGYSGNNCQTNINECGSSPCQNAAICVDGVNKFTCSCYANFTGTLCETDVNECGTNNGGCDTLTSCINTFGGFVCTDCPTGYNGTGLTNCTLATSSTGVATVAAAAAASTPSPWTPTTIGVAAAMGGIGVLGLVVAAVSMCRTPVQRYSTIPR